MKPITPFKTLLISQDGTYPGLVLDNIGVGYNVRWFKWGWNGPDYMDVWETEETILAHIYDEYDCVKKFGGLSGEKRRELKKRWAEKQLHKLAIAWESARLDAYADLPAVWDELKNFVLGLIDD